MNINNLFQKDNPWHLPKFLIALAIALVFALLLFGLPPLIFKVDNTFENMLKTRVLRVLTRNTSTTFYEVHDEPAGLEYDLIKAYADQLNVKVEIIIKPSIPELLVALNNGEGDIIAGGITRTEERETIYSFGPDYQSVQQQVVCNKNNDQIKEPKDLAGIKLAVIEGSSYEETLNSWKQKFPTLEWIPSRFLSTEQLLENVAIGKLDCTLSDSNIFAINRRYYPNLQIAFSASEEQQLAWILPPDADSLATNLELWFEKEETSGLLASIKERYYGHVEFYDFVDLQAFNRRIKQRLPKYRALFEKAAKKHDLPWTLLAAQAYQESHWHAKAKSPTGVRGLMMLTLNTAKSVGVKSRLDPEQSIMGGAKYLSRMMKRLPEDITDENRLYFALAAYNVGMGHLKDARLLAPSVGKNPDEWTELKEVLPLLSEKVFYEKLKRGYAQGKEPVDYVTRIRNYEDVLKNSLKDDSPVISQVK